MEKRQFRKLIIDYSSMLDIFNVCKRYAQRALLLSLSLSCAATNSGKNEHSLQCQYHLEQSSHTLASITALSYGSVSIPQTSDLSSS